MTTISIVGTSGVGKSFLVKQLAALTQTCAFFEGEEGSIPADILENVFSEQNPVKRYAFFVNRLTQNLTQAKKISENGLNCFIDGDALSPEAIMHGERLEKNKELLKMIADIQTLSSDLVIVLTADETYLKQQIQKRARASEKNNHALARAVAIQNAYVYLANKKQNTLVIDRTKLDFSSHSDLNKVLEKIHKTTFINIDTSNKI